MQFDLFGETLEAYNADGLTCIKCKKLKPFEAFSNASGGKYKNTTCKKCTNKNSRVVNNLRDTTAPAPDDHRCPICLRQKEELICPTKPNKTVWSLDHDHEHQTFRGWLCHRCNRGIGLIGDSIENAERVLKYLKANNGSS